jgi:hypothetical protein
VREAIVPVLDPLDDLSEVFADRSGLHQRVLVNVSVQSQPDPEPLVLVRHLLPGMLQILIAFLSSSG